MKKFLKTLAFITLVLSLSATLISCDLDNKEQTDSNKNTIDYEAPEHELSQSEEKETTEKKQPKNDTKKPTYGISVDPTVIFDKGGIKITVVDYDYEKEDDDEINYIIENNSDSYIEVKDNTLLVNGYVNYEGIDAEVPAGETYEDYFSLDEELFIGDAGKIELYLDIYDEEYEYIYENEYVFFETSAADDVDYGYIPEGNKVYDDNGITIIATDLEKGDYYTEFYLYVENNNGETICIDAEEMTVNGTDMDVVFIETIPHGKKYYEYIRILGDDLAENSIENIEEIVISFDIHADNEDYDTIDEPSVTVYKA